MNVHPRSSNAIEAPPTGDGTAATDYDAVVVGAGFGGLRMLHELRRLGLSVHVIEAGADVGGTWYWNRYPGARTDTEAWAYIMNFSEELKTDWVWPERYPAQADVERYLQHVTERFDMRRDIQFNTRVTSATYDEAANRWTIVTEAGQSFTCTYFVSASGVLSVAVDPPFPGLNSFTGQWMQTSSWPKEPVDFTDKRVAVVGTGATGVQVIPEVARTAAHVTVFQRTPNYVIPARNHALTDAQRAEVGREYDELWSKCREQVFAFPMNAAGRMMGDLSPDQQQQVLEAGWEIGGFRFVFETVDDMFVNDESNETAAEFIRKKIRAIVKDPKTAELLCPNYPLFAKRPPLGHFFYEAMNRDNVTLVDVSDNPIEEVTPRGMRTQTDDYEFDIIIFAIGFDAGTGALANIDVRGTGGQTLTDKWAEGPRTYLGIGVDGFPNMFMISGPQSPIANIPVIIDNTVDWIGQVITHMRQNGYDRMEPTAEACEQWQAMSDAAVDALVLTKADVGSYFFGGNIPGKPRKSVFYFGGAPAYFQYCQEVADGGFTGIAFRTTSGVSSAIKQAQTV
jgi:cation diffusion facilitator CzcD-associated flavoprotein CzcO